MGFVLAKHLLRLRFQGTCFFAFSPSMATSTILRALSQNRQLAGATGSDKVSKTYEIGQPFFFTLQPFFFHPTLFFPPSTFLFHPLNLFFSPSNLFFSPSTLSVLTLDPFFFTLLPLLGMLVGWLQTKYRQPLGKTQGGVALVAWFVGCLVGCQRKASIDSIWGN